MAFFTLMEFVDLIIMTLGIGYILKDSFGMSHYSVENGVPSKYESLKLSIIVAAPAVILHELGHKFVAMYYGLEATFHAAYGWLGFGVLLKLLNTGFIFFVPGYVSHAPAAFPLQDAMIAFAGPLMNLLLWIGAIILLKQKKWDRRTTVILVLTKKINMFLFFFNLIPIGFFDGAHVAEGIIKHFAQ